MSLSPTFFICAPVWKYSESKQTKSKTPSGQNSELMIVNFTEDTEGDDYSPIGLLIQIFYKFQAIVFVLDVLKPIRRLSIYARQLWLNSESKQTKFQQYSDPNPDQVLLINGQAHFTKCASAKYIPESKQNKFSHLATKIQNLKL